jgi:hypothetical protein
MPHTIRTPGGRTPKNLIDEYNSAMITIAERCRRMPGTPEGMAYAASMREIGAGLACCMKPDGALVDTETDLAVAEAALIAARVELKASIPEFLALDILAARVAPREAVPQIVTAGFAMRESTANGADAR